MVNLLDEAHKAVGKYAYSNISKVLNESQSGYRVLALSATPGNSIEKIQLIIDTLSISRIEMRQEDDPDVNTYLQHKAITPLLISGDGAVEEGEELVNVIVMKIISKLKNYLTGKSEQALLPSKSQMNYHSFKRLYDSFKSHCRFYESFLHKEGVNDIYSAFKIAMRLVWARKAICEQGFLAFKGAILGIHEYLVQNETLPVCKEILCYLPYVQLLSSLQNFDEEKQEDHPKMKSLMDICGNFFDNPVVQASKSKCIVFTNSRANAANIVNFLKNHPSIKPEVFLGHGGGKNQQEGTKMTQKMQIEIIQKFKANIFNVLVATCVAEEGLDIGEVDLIICFDSGLSPIRLVQRMGRTGRKRAGKVILLLNISEYKTYKSSNSRYKGVMSELRKANKNHHISGMGNGFKFYDKNPRMIPDDVKILNLHVEESEIKEKLEIDDESVINDVDDVEKLIENIILQAKIQPTSGAKKEKSCEDSSKKLDSFFKNIKSIKKDHGYMFE